MFTPNMRADAQTTYNYTGGAQTYTVPAGVTTIGVVAVGGSGGNYVPYTSFGTNWTNGGNGGSVSATLTVSPGEVLTIYVAGAGAMSGGSSLNPGGYNGGGAAAYGAGCGGGASDIRKGGTALTDRVIVAGGGGGGGSTYSDSYPGTIWSTTAGGGGGLTGGNGASISPSGSLAYGGTQSGGGNRGSYSGYFFAQSGDLGTGGNGEASYGGGGGGAGYYGGGGNVIGNGGGGSSYTDPELTNNVIHNQGVNSGNGYVIICIPPAIGTVSGADNVCAASTTTFSYAGGTTGGSWSSGNTGVATVDETTGVVTGISAGTSIISYSLSYDCGTISAVKAITVNPLPNAGTISGSNIVCLGATTTLNTTGTGGIWSSNNIGVATVDSTGIVTGTGAGTAQISYTATNVCGTNIAVAAVTINAMSASIVGASSVCTGMTLSLSDSTFGGVWSSDATGVATVNGSGVVSAIAEGVTTISYTCGTGVATKMVSVNCTGFVTPDYDYAYVVPDGVTSVQISAAGAKGGNQYYGGGVGGNGGNAICTLAVYGGEVLHVYVGGVGADYGYPGANGGGYSYSGGGGGGGSDVRANGTDLSNRVLAAGGGGGGGYYYYSSCTNSNGGAGGGTTGGSGLQCGYPFYAYGGTQYEGGYNYYSYSNNGSLGTGGSGAYASSGYGGGGGGGWYGGAGGYSSGGGGGSSYYQEGNPDISGFSTTGGTNAGNGYVTITPLCRVNVGTIAGASSVCTGASIALSDTVTGGTWSSGAPSVATVDSAGVVTGVSGGTAAITYSVAGECGVGRLLKVITVNTLAPAGTISGSVVFCKNATLALTEDINEGTWSSSSPAIATVGSTGVVTGTGVGTAVISYGVTNMCGTAYATTITTVITVPAIPSITGTTSVCEGATTTMTNAMDGGFWFSTDEEIAIINSSGVVSGISAGSTIIAYAVNNMCGINQRFKTITINDAPDVAAISGSSSMCVGATTTLTDATTGGSWISGSPEVATVGSTGIVTGLSAGTAAISYAVSGTGCTGYNILVMTVNAPSAITGSLSVCSGAGTTLGNSISGGTWSSGSTGIATVGSSSGIATGVSAGTAGITYAYSGCTSTAILTVNALPDAGTITGPSSLIAGSSISLSNAVGGGSWSASNSNATVSSTGVVTGETMGSVVISYSVSNGCGTAVAIKTITVGSAVDGITGTLNLCAGTTTTLSNATSGGTWSSSNTAVATISSGGVVTGVTPGVSTVSYTTSAGYATAIVTVSNTPAAITGTLALCVGGTTTLNNVASGSGTWSSSNASVATIGATSGVLTAVGTGTTNITYNLGSGCTATAVATVSMPAIIGGTSNTCVGQTATLTDATAGGAWSTSNIALATVDATTGVVTGIAAGTPTISYIVSTGCYRTITFTVKALPPAIAGPVTVCEGGTAYVTPPSSNGQSWTSSNTSVATIGSSSNILTGVSAGTTTLTYTTITGCYVTAIATVNAAPAAITGTTVLCAGGTSSLSSITSGGAWSSSNTSVAMVGSATGVLTAGSAGTATVTYNAGGCRAYTVATVSPIAAITGTPSMCVGSSTTLSNATTGGTWSSSNTGVATVGTSGIVTGVATGTATITYTIASGCSRTVTATVVATPGAITGTLSVCPAMTTSLSNASAGGTWSSSMTTKATINPSTGVLTGVAAGTTNVTYTIGTGCRTISVATVNPQPAVIAGTTNACVAQTAVLTDATAGGTWSSNNTAIATVDPSTGVVTGVSAATATMTYTLGTGCFRTSAFTVKALPPAIAASVVACVGTTTYIAPPSTNGQSWSSSNTTIATIGSSNNIMTGVSTGTTTLTYTTTTGCFVTTVATVYALPSAGSITGPTSVIVGSTITLNDAAGGGVWSSSNTARATIGSATGIVTGVAGGAATISYSVSNPGCTVRATQIISVLTSRPEGSWQSAVGSLQLYPNPTTGAFTVEVEEAGTFSIFSMDGREVSRQSISQGATQLNLSKDLASGIYMCRYTSESGSTTMVRLVYER
jgi:uncharacterized protein YjdB